MNRPRFFTITTPGDFSPKIVEEHLIDRRTQVFRCFELQVIEYEAYRKLELALEVAKKGIRIGLSSLDNHGWHTYDCSEGADGNECICGLGDAMDFFMNAEKEIEEILK